MLKKLLRNVVILIVFCAALFGVIQIGNYLIGKRSETQAADVYTQARIDAEQNLVKRRYRESIKNYDEVISDDPYNGHAVFKRAYAHRKIFFDMASRGRTSDAETEKAGRAAIAAYEPALEFPLYRNRTRHALSHLHAWFGDDEKAIEYIALAVQDGYQVNAGLMAETSGKFYYKDMIDGENEDLECVSFYERTEWMMRKFGSRSFRR